MESWLIIVITAFLLAEIIYLILKKIGVTEIKDTGKGIFEADAKKFARLLITEIKLYEDYKVQRGLRNNNLYESLKDEIEEARKKYIKRVSSSEFEQYFNDALVEVLANGDKSKIGTISTSLN